MGRTERATKTTTEYRDTEISLISGIDAQQLKHYREMIDLTSLYLYRTTLYIFHLGMMESNNVGMRQCIF